MFEAPKRLGMVALGAMMALAMALAAAGCDGNRHRCNCPDCPGGTGQLGAGDLE